MNKHLCIATGCETVSAFLKFPAQILKVIYLSIENNADGPILIGHGLLASHEVYDGEAAMTKQNALSLIDAFTIRTAVRKGHVHSSNNGGIGTRTDYAADTTHRRFLSFSNGLIQICTCVGDRRQEIAFNTGKGRAHKNENVPRMTNGVR